MIECMKAGSKSWELDCLPWGTSDFFVSVKEDGYRVRITRYGVYSKTLKPYPNKAFRDEMLILMDALRPDGEFIEAEVVCPEFGQCGFLKATEAPIPVGTRVVCFDCYHPVWSDATYLDRRHALERTLRYVALTSTASVLQNMVCKIFMSRGKVFGEYDQEVIEFSEDVLQSRPDIEGFIAIDVDLKYTPGRLKDGQGIFKILRYETCDAVIVGINEGLMKIPGHATKRNPDGSAKRVSRGSKIPSGTFGSFTVRCVGGQFDGKEVNIGRWEGFTKAFGDHIWNNQQDFMGRTVRFLTKPGAKNLPRLPKKFEFRDDKE